MSSFCKQKKPLRRGLSAFELCFCYERFIVLSPKDGLSHLVAIHVKKSYGRLSPLCGATGAAVGASAGLVLLMGGGLDQVIAAVQNMFGTLTGMICDGAKLGCALKVSVSIYGAVQAALVAMRGKEIAATDGVIESDVEETIRNMERISKEGMTQMDDLLLNIMLNKQGDC